MNDTVRVYVGEEIARYGFGNGHPFGPHRMGAFWDEAIRRGIPNRVKVCDPVMALQDIIELFHTPEYVDQVRRQSLTGDGFLDYGDTPAFQGVYEATAHVVGSALDAMESILSGTCRRAFIPIAGLHHARPERAGGFCVFNDCGVTIAALRERHDIRRVAYIDIDAHHGDGVFYAFESDPDLIFADLHADGRFLYPGTGHAYETGQGAAQGTKLNIPLPPDADDSVFFQEWPKVERYLEEAQPEFFLLQCGADSIAGDPITHMRFSPAAHAHAAASLCRIAEKIGHGRVMAVGGGGYNTENIANGWCAVVEALIGSEVGSG
ncbi:MAG: acetoin utilization protein AcuC [Magnetococcales bacterium]|nr:acetoin utilization protein AcuC [Magnetococcales bacterium]